MGRTYKVIVALILVVIVGYTGWRYYQARKAAKAGILTENIVHKGNDWTADFTATIPAPEQEVYNAVRDVEKTRSDQIRSVRVISQSDNAKTVELVMNGPGGQTITAQMAFQYDPAGRRISARTLDNPTMDMRAEYKFDEDGSSTLITCHQTTTMLQQLPVPDAVVRQVIRGVFIAQLDGLRRTLNIASSEQPEDTGEEP